METLNVNEVKKELYKNKSIARLSHYTAGNIYYEVEVLGGKYQFPITVADKVNTPLFVLDSTPNLMQSDVDPTLVYARYSKDAFNLSEDLGTTAFNAEMKASDLNRWIAKAVEHGEFVKVG